jgi:ABC-type multidrug transport system fused ATPase/permease subunit
MVRFRGFDEEREDRGLELRHLRKLWPFVRPYRTGFTFALAMLVGSFAIAVLKPWLYRNAIDGPLAPGFAGDPGRELLGLGAWFLAATIADAVLLYAYSLITARNGQSVVRDLRTTLHGHLLRLGIGFFDRHASGRLVTRVTSDVENLNELIATGVLQASFDLLKIFGITALLFLIQPGLAGVLAAGLPLLVLLSVLFRNRMKRSFREVRRDIGRQNAFAGEAIGGIRVTRGFGREDVVADHHRELNAATRGAWQRTIGWFSTFASLLDFTVFGLQVTILGFGGHAVLRGTMTPGEFIQFWMYFGLVTGPIRELGEKYNVLQSAFASAERIFGILAEPQFPPAPGGAVPARRGPPSIRFDEVVYGYDKQRPILRGISFAVGAGETVALVGPTGAGKTTVLALVSRLFDPDRGSVRIDGQDLRELDVEALRRRIAVVQQDVFLFSGSVLENVRLFDASIPQAAVERALAAVDALDFVRRLPDGIHTKLAERGVTLSLGERQLLSFARALAADPDLLVLDEATASIDSHSEQRIQRALREVLRGRTCLVVAHRLSTVRDADRILVLQRGELVESGTHDELLAAGGLYGRMLRAVATRAG